LILLKEWKIELKNIQKWDSGMKPSAVKPNSA